MLVLEGRNLNSSRGVNSEVGQRSLRKPNQPNKKGKASLPATRRSSSEIWQALGRGVEGCLQTRWRLCGFPVAACSERLWCFWPARLPLLGLDNACAIFSWKCWESFSSANVSNVKLRPVLFLHMSGGCSFTPYLFASTGFWFRADVSPFKLLGFPRISVSVCHYFAWIVWVMNFGIFF